MHEVEKESKKAPEPAIAEKEPKGDKTSTQDSNEGVVGRVVVVKAQSRMDGDHEQQQKQQDGSPTSYPVASSSTHTQVPNSVVSDLMKVYESLTKSSTPQNPPSNSTQTATAQQYQQETGNRFNVPAAKGQPVYIQPQPTQQQQSLPLYQSNYALHPMLPAVPPVPDYPAAGQTVHPVAVPSEVNETIGGRSLRKRSMSDEEQRKSNKSRRKSTNTDGRWSKRFTWPDNLHRDFVSAIFDVGLKHSSPSALLEFLPKHDQLTSERIKSHLQKYRLHRVKSKSEFMSCYDHSLSKFQASGLDGIKALSSGEVPAQLAYSTLTGAEGGTNDPAFGFEPQEAKSATDPNTATLVLPKLTEEEKNSPVGMSLGYLLGLFFSLQQQLMDQRAAAAAAAAAESQPVTNGVSSLFAPAGASSTDNWQTVPPVDRQDASQDQMVVAAIDSNPAAKGLPATPAGPSTMSNLEENNMMKREMQNQMLFQNKMRALKQQELNKYKNPAAQTYGNDPTDAAEDGTREHVVTFQKEDGGGGMTKDPNSDAQGAGETAEASDSSGKERMRGLSVGASDEFWNSDEVVDDRLFEFLMDPP